MTDDADGTRPRTSGRLLYVFVLASFIGLGVIRRVSRLLHTPLMSLTNAISAIAVVGAILVTGGDYPLAHPHPRRHRALRLDDQHRQRLPDHRPHAEDVQDRRRSRGEGGQLMMHGVGQLAYIVASALFIFALHWMNTPATARKGVYAGVAGTAHRDPRHLGRARRSSITCWIVAARSSPGSSSACRCRGCR